jgi:hypothetical protein
MIAAARRTRVEVLKEMTLGADSVSGHGGVAWWMNMAIVVSCTGLSLSATGDGHTNREQREKRYLAESDLAMRKMMRRMAIARTGDVDKDFVTQMIPHHQGAIDMAEALLQTGQNERLKRLAQEIVVTQREEIAAMRLAVASPAESP